MLAIAAAYAVPLVSGAGRWSKAPRDGFVILILVTGLAAAGLRGWTVVGGVTLAGAGLWALVSGVEGDLRGLSLLAAAAPILALAAFAFARRAVSRGASPSGDHFGQLPVAAVVGAWTGIPVRRMVRDEAQAVLNLADALALLVAQRDELDAGLLHLERQVGIAQAHRFAGVGGVEGVDAGGDVVLALSRGAVRRGPGPAWWQTGPCPRSNAIRP